MSTTKKNLTIETGLSPEESKEAMLYRPQLLKYKYKTCIEKPVLTDTYDPDTMNSLKSLMKTTSINMAHQNKQTSSKYNERLFTSQNTAKPKIAQEKKIYYLNG